MSTVLRYATYGDDDAPALVLLHAFPLSGAMWGDVLARLVPAARVVVPELISGVPVGQEPSLDVLAEGVLGVLDQLGVQRATVAGVSMGGYVAMALARLDPARIAALGLLDTRAGADEAQAREDRLRVADTVLAEESTRSLVESMPAKLLGATTHRERPHVVDLVRGWISAVEPAGVAWCQRAMAARTDSTAVLSGLDVPVLVLVGDEDVLSPPAEARRMVDAVRDGLASYVEVPGAGHLAAVEHAEVVAAALDDLVRRAAQG